MTSFDGGPFGLGMGDEAAWAPMEDNGADGRQGLVYIVVAQWPCGAGWKPHTNHLSSPLYVVRLIVVVSPWAVCYVQHKAKSIRSFQVRTEWISGLWPFKAWRGCRYRISVYGII